MIYGRLVAGERSKKTAFPVVSFFLSSLIAGVLLAACDSGTPAEPTVSGTPSAAAGLRVYAQYCNQCHPGGERGAGPALKPLLPVVSDAQIITYVRHGKPPMPGYNEKAISEDQMTSLLLYLRSMK